MSSSSLPSAPSRGRARRLLAGVLAAALTAGVSAAAAAPTYAAESAPAQLAATGSIYEAEDGQLTGVTRQTEHAGYTGTGFVGGFGSTGHSVRTTVTAATAGAHDLFIRYANGNGSNRTLTLAVNGTTRQITLPSHGQWNTWGFVWAPVDLQAGANTIQLTRTAADSGQLNVDHLRVAPQVGTRYEAEAATLSGGAVVASDHAGYTGTGFVGGIQAVGAAVTFTVTATEAGNHPSTLRYAAGPNPFNGPKRVTLEVNGTQRSIVLPGFSSWKTWGDYALDLPLVAGANAVTIRYTAGDDGNVNLDHLDVGQPAPPVCDPVVEPDDAFSGTTLDRCRWTTVLNEDTTGYRVAGGVLSIDARPGDLSGGVTNARNVILQPAPAGARWMAETAVSLDGTDDYLQAGIVLWGNAANFGKLSVIKTPTEGWKVELGRVTANTLKFTGSATLPAGAQTDVRLRLSVVDGALRGAYSLDDGATWTVVGPGYGVDGISNPLVGVAAFNGTGAETARFESFDVGAPVLVAPTVTVDPASVVTGQTTTVTVTVAGRGATPTGDVTLRDGDTVVGTTALTDGVATFTVGPYASTGDRTLTATYAGDTAFATATGDGTLSVTAAPVASTTTVVADPGSIETGQTSTVTVTVAAEGTTPSGEVTLRDGDEVVGRADLSDGAATFTVGPYTAAGTRTFTATYAGATGVTGSTGTGTLTVTQAPVASTTTVTANPGSVQTGQTSTVTVTVAAQGTTPTGQVTLRDGDQVLGTADLTDGTASFTVGPFATAGSRTLTATYAGSATVAGSTGTGTLTVTQAPVASTTTVVANPSSVTTGQTSTVSVTVAAQGTTPTGQVTLREGDQVLGTAPLVNGVAMFQAGPYATAGTRTLTATYAGSATVAGSSGTGTLTVTAPVASTTTLAADPSSVQTGQTSTVTVTVTAQDTTPTGKVTLFDGEEFVASAFLDEGVVTFPVGPYAVAGVRQLSAVYDGSATVAGSTGTGTLTVTAAPVASTVDLTGPMTVRTGQGTSVTVTVTAEGVTPTGAVQVSDGTTTWTGDLVDGTAVVPVGPWATAGTRTLTATYAGDAQVTGSDDTLQIVVQAPPAPTPVVRVVGGKVDAAANRRTGTVRLACTPAGVVCRGTVTLRAGGKVLGQGTSKVTGGKTGNVKVALNARARRALAAKPRTRAELVVVMGGKRSVVRVALTR